MLAVEVFSPTETDLAITFVDWNPAPPGQEYGPVARRGHHHQRAGCRAPSRRGFESRLAGQRQGPPHRHGAAEERHQTHPVKGTLKGAIEKTEFSQEVELGPGESKRRHLHAGRSFRSLISTIPRLWWPAQMGKPELYTLSAGIRSWTARLPTARKPGLAFARSSPSLSRQPALVFDQWQKHPDPRRRLVSRHDAARRPAAPARPVPLRAGHGPEHDSARRQAGDRTSSSTWPMSAGILVMAGWCCCDHWEHWPNWKPQDFDYRGTIAARPDLPPARPSQPDGLDERQRQSASA